MEKATEQKAKNLLRLPEENEKKSLQEKKKMKKLEIKYKEEVEKKIKEAEIKHKIAESSKNGAIVEGISLLMITSTVLSKLIILPGIA